MRNSRKRRRRRRMTHLFPSGVMCFIAHFHTFSAVKGTKCIREGCKNGNVKLKRYISYYSLQNQGSLKSVDDETFNLLLSNYKNKNCLNLSVSNNMIPKYLQEYFMYDLNKNLYFDRKHLKMIENTALSTFNLEPKYWGGVFSVNTTDDCRSSEIDDYFLLKLFRNFINYKAKIMNISFALSEEGGKNTESDPNACNIIENFYDIIHVRIKDRIDYEEIRKKYEAFKPQLMHIDETNNPYNFNYEFVNNLRGINKCIVITNMSNKASLISQNLIPSPFNYSDMVYTYYNENMRAHNCYIIFYKKGYKHVDKGGKLIQYEYEKKLKNSFFPNCVNNTIFSLLTSFKLMKNCEFKEYLSQSQENTFALFTHVNKNFFSIRYSKNSNFLNLNCRNCIFNVYEFHELCKELNIFFDILNPNKYAQTSFNIGTNYLTSIGLLQNDMKTVAEFINRTHYLYFSIKRQIKCSSIEFSQYLKCNNSEFPDMLSLSNDIYCFITSFPSM
ncbi:serine hydroxymethyltransferase [Plasmodium gonderi]|uniref:Serine hydroxymethyltransferase n=1 Tax=Plasmodium gonderi TaxID=77519 RepID=A0A1Y1JM35_PLAGO|nr:serine hydroxymethyltransferase [Plasmodium gonderi]GAW82525.1 serine hydroxymethyltransferase [Plasmodium gonderi]